MIMITTVIRPVILFKIIIVIKIRNFSFILRTKTIISMFQIFFALIILILGDGSIVYTNT